MNENFNRVLSIDPGTRFMGFAVLDDEGLTYYAIKTINDRRTPRRIFHRAKEFLREFVRDYKPSVVAIEKPFVYQTSAAVVSVLADELKKEAERVGLNAYQYTPTSIRQYLCQSGTATKPDVAKAVAGLFPELNYYLNPMHEWTEKYYSNLFDAIAVGLMCRHDLQSREAPAAGLAEAA
jgi:Holliday junction resolvasome RuvABC endonuclease subunit